MYVIRFCALVLMFSIIANITYATGPQLKKNTDLVGVVPDKYIVLFRKGVSVDKHITRLTNKYGITIDQKYRKTLQGFSASLSDSQVALLKKEPAVLMVEQDRIVTVNGVDESIVTLNADPYTEQVQDNSRKRIGGDSTTHTGAGIGIAVLDNGIDRTHPDLVNSVSPVGTSCVPDSTDPFEDTIGFPHGTYVAGIIGAEDNDFGVLGVAPDATLFSVRVTYGGEGTSTTIACGLEWVAQNATTYGIRVVNMSLSFFQSTTARGCNEIGSAIQIALCNLRNQGVVVVSSAGNTESDTSANARTPCIVNYAVICVSSIADSDGLPGGLGSGTVRGNADDEYFEFSYGSAVDISAPGEGVLSTGDGNTYISASGTSGSTPMVSGAVALLLEANPTAKIGQTGSFSYKTPSLSNTTMRVRNILIGLAEKSGPTTHSDPTGLHREPVLKINTL